MQGLVEWFRGTDPRVSLEARKARKKLPFWASDALSLAQGD